MIIPAHTHMHPAAFSHLKEKYTWDADCGHPKRPPHWPLHFYRRVCESVCTCYTKMEALFLLWLWLSESRRLVVLLSTESNTGWSYSKGTTSPASAWRCVRTVLSCRLEASPRTASSPSRFTGTERTYLHLHRFNGFNSEWLKQN